MSFFKTTTRRLGGAPAALALGLFVAGCGGGASHTTASSTPAAPASAATSSAPVPPHLLILAPRRGAHTGQSVTVRVRLSGATATDPNRFRYVLDGRISRLGPASLTFHELAPGSHRLVVMLAGDQQARASSLFVVRAPAPVTAPEPPRTEPATTPTREAAPAPAPPKTTTQAPAPGPAPKSHEPPPAEEAIPQNNGGDHDSDNNGGPSDGDGNV